LVFGLLAGLSSNTKVVAMHDALCTRCGTELEYPPTRAPAPVEPVAH